MSDYRRMFWENRAGKLEKQLKEFDSQLSKLELEARQDAGTGESNILAHNYEEGKAAAYTFIRSELHNLFPDTFPEYQKPAEKK